MPFEIKTTGSFNEISDWLCSNVGKSVKTDTSYDNKFNWQVLPHGISNTNSNKWVIRLWDPDKVVLCKLRWE